MRALFLFVLLTGLFPQHQGRSRIQAESLDGVWASEGYGLLVEIQRDNLTTHEITAISCLPSWVAKRTAKTANETVFTGEHRVIRFPNRPTTDTTRMHVDGTASDILLQRTSERTGRCGLPTDNTPQANYAIFWQTFRENYPFFELHHLDWSALDKEFRPQVRPATKPEELFRFLRQMIEPLHDAHTGIAATDIKQSFDGWRPDPNHLEEEEWKKALEIIDSKYVWSSLRSFCNDRVQYGTLRSSIGYLRITTFYDYVNKEGYVNGLGALQSALDTIFQKANLLSGLVIDVRLNKGGDDPLGIEVASRLTQKKYLAYSKVARDDRGTTLHFTVPQKTWVVPSRRPGFRGKVVILTGPDTVSAGETFTMALLGREPHITRIGLNTQGVFSDVLNRSLPNGWRFRLPNEVYLTKQGKSFDGSGVPPDIREPFFSRDDLRNGRDSALDKALRLSGWTPSARTPSQ